MGISWGCNISGLWPGKGPSLPLSIHVQVKCPWGSPQGPSPEIGSTPRSWKVTCLSNLCRLRNLSHLSRHLLYRQLPLRLWEHWCWMLSASWLSLLMSSSSLQAVSNAHWWASLASWGASSCGLHLLWDLDQASGWWTGQGLAAAAPCWSSSSMAALPTPQMAPQWGQDVLDSFFPQSGPTWQWARWPY